LVIPLPLSSLIKNASNFLSLFIIGLDPLLGAASGDNGGEGGGAS